MDIVTAALICLRRWYVFVPVVALGAFFAAQAYSNTSVTYEAQGAVIVLPKGVQVPEPPSTEGSLRINPYSLGGGTRLLSVVLTHNLVSADVRERVSQQVPGVSYTTESSRLNPIVNITASGPTAEAAERAVGVVVTQAEPVVRQIQLEAGSPESRLYSASRAMPTSLTSVAAPGRLKGAAATLLVAIALGGMLSLMVDAVSARRSARVRLAVPSVESLRPQAPSHHAKKASGPSRRKRGRDEDRVAVS